MEKNEKNNETFRLSKLSIIIENSDTKNKFNFAKGRNNLKEGI